MKGGKGRSMYKPCNEQQNRDLNYELCNTITQPADSRDSYKVIKAWLKQGIESIPKSHPKDKNKRFELSENQKPPQEKKTSCKRQKPKTIPRIIQRIQQKPKRRQKNKDIGSNLQRSRPKRQMARDKRNKKKIHTNSLPQQRQTRSTQKP